MINDRFQQRSSRGTILPFNFSSDSVLVLSIFAPRQSRRDSRCCANWEHVRQIAFHTKTKRQRLDLPFIDDPILDPYIRTVAVARKKRKKRHTCGK